MEGFPQRRLYFRLEWMSRKVGQRTKGATGPGGVLADLPLSLSRPFFFPSG
jgi:hypothetical protein